MAPGARKVRAALQPHAATPRDAVRKVVVEVCRMPGGALTVTYHIEAEMARLSVAPASSRGRQAERLWEHTCCEIFIARALPAYHEFNFSPSGAWAAYSFQRYREGAPRIDEALDPQVRAHTSANRMELGATIRLDRLAALDDTDKLSLAVSAVIEDRRGALGYWALKHPPGKPDFHHPDSFVLELDAVRH
jgi:hypothetical protein